jgi:hypothetical protein
MSRDAMSPRGETASQSLHCKVEGVIAVTRLQKEAFDAIDKYVIASEEVDGEASL